MNFLAETLGLTALISMNNPLEMLKSRLQTTTELINSENLQQSHTVVQSFRNIIETEGLRALWKGNLLNILRYFPVEKLNYEAKNYIKNFLPKAGPYNFISGVLGGWLASMVFYPLDALRVSVSISSVPQK